MLYNSKQDSPVRAEWNGQAATMPEQFLDLLADGSPQRPYAEAFIQRIFYSSYRARITSFYPDLFSITHEKGGFTAVAGVRSAAIEPLFSEHYLDIPIETMLGVPREQIVEIGNLSPAGIGQARWLITTLNAFMTGAGFTHVVFTAVPKLRNAFRRMGLPLKHLADASSERLPQGMTRDWGSYYDASPAVFSGDIGLGEAFLAPMAMHDSQQSALRQNAFDLGRLYKASLSMRDS